MTNLPASMTVEAWVYREDDTRCETIVGQNFLTSFWFGICSSKLRFYRSGGGFADADRNVPEKRWTHVAASYAASGASGTVSFYIDGVAAGVRSLANAGGNHNIPIFVGRDAGGGIILGSTYPFLGNLDEVRIWSGTRTLTEIRADRFEEVTTGNGLAFRFSGGVPFESVTGNAAVRSDGVQGDIWGVLPRDLTIPTTTLAPTLDGNIGASTEYLGSEQMIYRYVTDTQEVDTRLRLLAHRTSFGSVQAIWAGLSTPGEVGGFTAMNGASVRFLLDGNNSGGTVPAYQDFRLDYSLFTSSPTQTVAEVPLVGGFTTSPLQVANYFTVSSGFCESEFAPACAEFRIPWNNRALGASNQFRIMTQLYRPASTGVTLLDRRNPLDADPAIPNTWPVATLGGASSGASSRIRIHVEVTNYRPGSFYVRNQIVDVVDRRDSRVLARIVVVSGDLVQELDVPRGAQIRLRLVRNTEWEYATAVHRDGTDGVDATALRTDEVDYPACNESFCRLRDVIFRVGVAPGPSTLGPIVGVTRNADYYPVWTLRAGSNPKILPASEIFLTGVNLHDRMSVWAAPGLPGIVPTGEMAEPPSGQGYVALPLVSAAADGGSLLVRTEVPDVHSQLSIWVRDNWTRTGMGSRWKFAGTAARVEPPYPLIHGFEFRNERDGTQFDEFSGVFQWNAYDCVTPIGPIPHLQTCIGCRIPNPLYLTFHSLVFTPWVELMTGSCLGMSATSLQFARGELVESSLDRDVRYANGFPGIVPLPSDENQDLMPPKPQQHRFRPCDYSEPVNLWAHIHRNQAIQTSAEFLRNTLDQMDGTGLFFPVFQRSYTIEGNPVRTMERIRAGGFRNHLLCFQDGGDILRSHCIVPFGAAEDVGLDEEHALGLVAAPGRTVLNVYDSNDPGTGTRYFEINRTNNTFRYWFGTKRVITNTPAGLVTNVVDDIWTGRSAYATPISIFRDGRTMPGLDIVGMGIGLVFFGAADGRYENGDGGRWGWDGAGGFTNSYEGAKAIAPFTAGPGARTANTSRSLMFFPPTNRPPVKLEVNTRGKEWSFFGGEGGVICQLSASNATVNGKDLIEFGRDARGNLNAISYKPQFATKEVVTRLGVDSQTSPMVYEWLGLEFPAGGKSSFKVDKASASAEFQNQTGRETKHWLRVLRNYPGNDTLTTNVFGPFILPAGAKHRVEWPSPQQAALRSGVDRDGDGTVDEVVILGAAQGVNDPSLPPPRLDIALAKGTLVLKWPLRPEAWLLESSVALGKETKWVTVSTPPTLDGTNQRIELQADQAQIYYRLRQK